MGKTVAITGVNSYFASTLLPQLDADPEVEKIIGIDITPWRGTSAKVEFHREDIRSGKIADILKGVDTVYHLAFVVGEIHDKKKTYDININGSRNLFEACVKNGVKKVIYTSSMTIYGSHQYQPLGLTEESPLHMNKNSYYSRSKHEVESFVTGFFKDRPEITLTVLRAALLCGPHIDNMFSKLWSLPVSSLPMGRQPHNQFIHEEDLGEALHLALKKDLPGVYNVTADDAISTMWCFRTAGVIIVPLPVTPLKIISRIGFALRLFPAGPGWVSVGEYTIFGSSEKFKKAAGWKPRHTSEETFRSYLESRKRDRKDDPFRKFLSWGFRQGALLVGFFKGIHLLFLLGKIPGVRNFFPWTDPRKNSMTYLPINQSLKKDPDTVLPPQVLYDFIEQASIHYLIDHCGCRLAHKCENFPYEVGCLFMGESALKLPAGIGRKVTKEQALAHARRAVSVGLVPMTGKVRVDNSLFFVKDEKKLLTVCFCCHCCCMMGYLKHTPAEHLDQVITPVEGLVIEVTDACTGCGTCVETCIFEAISIKDGKAVHSAQCRGCGRCERYCPNGAITITLTNLDFKQEVKKRISSHVSF